VNFIILLVVLGGVAYRVTSAAERERGLQYGLKRLARVKHAIVHRREATQEFRAALRARTPFVVVTPAIGLIVGIAGIGLMFGSAAMADPAALISWGASVGTRTTNGEWWRLLTASFVHAGGLQLIIDLAVIANIGALLERLLGRSATASVYVAGGVTTALATVSFHPTAVTVSSPGAAAGLYGLLAIVLIAQSVGDLRVRLRARAGTDGEPASDGAVTIPLPEVKVLAAGAAGFLIYIAVASPAGLWGFGVGAAYGILLAPLRRDRQPTTRRVVIATGAAAAAAAMLAMPLRSIADVKPEIARVIAAEEHTSKTYQAALDAFKKGRTTADALARVAGGTNVAELEAVDTRLAALEHVPAEDQRLVRDARDYLRLRCQAWTLRADAVRRMNGAVRTAADEPNGPRRLQTEARFRSNMAVMGRAESAERASMTVFERLRAPSSVPE
jgi:membrane associated rhomboid family serine protease